MGEEYPVHDLATSDWQFEYSAGRATYMAIVDLAAFESPPPHGDFDTLVEHSLTQINRGCMVAWGCTQNCFSIRITTEPLKSVSLFPEESDGFFPELSDVFRPIASDYGATRMTTGYLSTGGLVCLTCFGSIQSVSHCFSERLPVLDHNDAFSDHVFRVSPGLYEITVYARYEWSIGEQFAEKVGNTPDFVVTVKKTSPSSEPAMQNCIPWFTLYKNQRAS